MDILFATDGSACALAAETFLTRLPHARTGTVHAVTVVPPPGVMMATLQPTGSFALVQQSGLLWQAHHEHGSTVVADAGARLRAAGLTTETHVLDGDIGPQLLDFAKGHGVGMIVVGSRGEGAFKAFFLGSVARRMLAYADVSVLVVRDREDCPPEEAARRLEAKQKLNVVVAVDGSVGSEAALDFLALCGEKAYDHAIAACAEPLCVLPPGMDPVDFAKQYGYDQSEAERIVAAATKRLEPFCDSVTGVARLSRPNALLESLAKEHDGDMIVMGATRQGFVERFLIGSVSYEVATSAPCAVLVVRPAK